jgi:hypothetical protein
MTQYDASTNHMSDTCGGVTQKFNDRDNKIVHRYTEQLVTIKLIATR